jgi:hypothetical protein
MNTKNKAALATFTAALAALTAIASPASAGLATGYSMETLPVIAEGQFTAHAGQLHYWTAAGGYGIYNVDANSTNSIGLPTGGTNTNGYGDAFGVLDPASGLFYAGTVYGMSDSDVYVYDPSGSGYWVTPGPDGVTMSNAYGAQVHNSQLYVAGLAEPWNGGYGQDNYIFAFDHSAGVNDQARHDTLIQTTGNSANLAVAPNGDIYYGTYSTNTLYRWTAAQVAGVTNDLYAGDADTFLTLADADASWTMPGAGNGVGVDAAGHVFVAVNSYPSATLAMLDDSAPGGWQEIYAIDDGSGWFGPISVDGDLLNGGSLYFSPTYGGGIAEITVVPEPATLTLLALGATLAAVRKRYRREQ